MFYVPCKIYIDSSLHVTKYLITLLLTVQDKKLYKRSKEHVLHIPSITFHKIKVWK